MVARYKLRQVLFLLIFTTIKSDLVHAKVRVGDV